MPKNEEFVTCEPPWIVPEVEKLQASGAPPTLEKNFRLHSRGLRKVLIEAMKVRNGKAGRNVGIFQKFFIALGDDDKPRMSPSLLARLVYFRAAQFAIDTEHNVTFRIYLNGNSAGNDKEWERQIRITIDPDDLDDSYDPEDDEDEGDDDEDDESEDDDDDDGEEDDEDYDEEDDDDEEEDEPAPRPRGERAQVVSAPPRTALPASVQVSPVVAEAQRMGLPVPQGMPIQVNPDFIVQIIEQSQAAAVSFFSAAGKEHRRMLRTMRRESVGLAREARRVMRTVTRDSIEQRRIANAHAEALGQQLIDQTQLNASHYENFQRIAQQGWTAFRHSMDTEMAQFERMREYERTIYGERIARAEEIANTPDTPSAWPGMVSRAMPTMLGVMAAVISEKNPRMGDMLAKLANLLMPKLDAEQYDEEYEDDEDAEPEPQRRAPPRAEPPPTEPTPASASSSSEPPPADAPTRDSVRAIVDTLSPQQRAKLQEKMPRTAWEALESAANARTESTARAAVARLDAIVRNDPALQMSVISVLSASQAEALMKLISQRQRRTAPPRPSAAAAAGA